MTPDEQQRLAEIEEKASHAFVRVYADGTRADLGPEIDYLLSLVRERQRRIGELEGERERLKACCQQWEENYTALNIGIINMVAMKMVPVAERLPPQTRMCIWFAWGRGRKLWGLGALSALEIEERGWTHWMPLPDAPAKPQHRRNRIK